jgi:hypothetical protein
MPHTPKLVLPTDPAYTAHRDTEKRHRETVEWLRRRECELGYAADAPSLAADEQEVSHSTHH